VTEPPYIISRAAFEKLGEYSCSLPTGPRVGFRWKRNNNAFRPPVRFEVLGVEFIVPWPEEWWMGEAVEDPDPKYVGIRWRRLMIKEGADART
jgi:hypothetical protein